MGTSFGDFFKYPRTPHLSESKGTDDDKRLSAGATQSFLEDPTLIVEEKLDGTNVGIHFAGNRLILQCRGHEITQGMHPQYDLFKQWATAKQPELFSLLGTRFLMYGEWLYATHTIHYRKLPHYFFEFDIFDKTDQTFLDLSRRIKMLHGTDIRTVPILHRGSITFKALQKLVEKSAFDARFENPFTRRNDNLMEGTYLRTELNGIVTARAKFVRPEFTEKIKRSSHWQYQPMIVNQLAKGVDLWS